MPSAIATSRLPSRRSTTLLAALALLPWPVRAAGEPPDAPPPQSQTETQETPAQALPEPVQEIIVTGRTDFGEIPYQKLAPTLKAMADLAAANGGRLRLAFKMTAREGKHIEAPMRIWAVRDGREEEIATTPDGYFLLPYRADWDTPETRLVTNQPKGTAKANLSVQVLDPDAPLPYAELRTAARLVDQGIEAWTGPVLGFFIPSVDQFSLACGPEPDCRVDAALDGQASLERDDDDQPRLTFTRRLDRAAPALRITATSADGTPPRVYITPHVSVF